MENIRLMTFAKNVLVVSNAQMKRHVLDVLKVVYYRKENAKNNVILDTIIKIALVPNVWLLVTNVLMVLNVKFVVMAILWKIRFARLVALMESF